MRAPQIVMIVVLVLNVWLGLEHHGEPERGTKSAWSNIIGTVGMVALLWWGGFWR